MAKFGIGQLPYRDKDTRLLTGQGRHITKFDLYGQVPRLGLQSLHARAGVGAIDMPASPRAAWRIRGDAA